MFSREELLLAIIAAPDEDAPRLLYADFLAQTGGEAEVARAELIRFQIETNRLSDDHPEKLDRIVQAAQMADRRKSDWFGWVRHPSSMPCPTRGFLGSWSCGAEEEQQADLKDAFGSEPITQLTLFPTSELLAALAEWPQLRRIRNLKLWFGTAHPEHALSFLASPHVSGLQQFEFFGTYEENVPLAEVCEFLAEQPKIRRSFFLVYRLGSSRVRRNRRFGSFQSSFRPANAGIGRRRSHLG